MTATTQPDHKPDGAPSQAPETEGEVVARLAALKPMDYDRVRREEAKALNILATTLDELVKAARSEDRAVGRMPFKDHEPADDPVDGAQLLTEIAAVIREYIVLDSEQADAAALWVLHTHLIAEAEVSPIAIINAPERACAKTLFQTLLSQMVYRPLPAANASLSAMFRAVEHWRPTLLIDEADTFFKENTELHGMVNSGYKRGGYVLRSESTGESYEPRTFSVYSAKSIAGIALERHLPDATMSRGIVFNMRRKLSHEKVTRMRQGDATVFDRLASQAVRFANDNSERIKLARPHLPDALSDRAQDNWEPLLAIAMCAGEEWLQRATKAALVMSAASEATGSTGNELLADIKEILDCWVAPTIKTVDLINALCDDEEKSWSTYNRGKQLTPRQLAKMLDIYGIKPKTVRQRDGTTPKGYECAHFKDAFLRYLKVEANETVTERPAAASLAPPKGPPTVDVADTAQRPVQAPPDAAMADSEAHCGGVAATGAAPPGDDPDDSVY